MSPMWTRVRQRNVPGVAFNVAHVSLMSCTVRAECACTWGLKDLCVSLQACKLWPGFADMGNILTVMPLACSMIDTMLLFEKQQRLLRWAVALGSTKLAFALTLRS